MSVTDARAVLADLPPDALRRPRIDKAAVARALGEYLESYGEARRPLRWFDDPDEAHRFIHRQRTHRAYAADSDGRLAALFDAAWDMAVPREGEEIPARFLRLIARLEHADDPDLADLHAPVPDMSDATRSGMVKAFAAGLLRFRVMFTMIVCVARPALWIADGRLHRGDGPAIVWPSGRRHHVWRGTRVEDWLIERPRLITPERIRNEVNLELRRCTIERFGIERFVREAGARLMGADRYGRLWRIRLDGGRDPYVVVEVENGTREPDGTRRRYFLRVPPTISSAHEAVAWTYGLTREQYAVAART
jgi:hypothetical protein